MKLNTKILSIFAILAVFGMLIVASTVSAANETKYLDDSEDGHNGTIIPPDKNHDEAKMLNQTNSTVKVNNTNQTDVNPHNTTNKTTNKTTNVTATHKLPVTGNPIVALFLISGAAAGICAIKRRK